MTELVCAIGGWSLKHESALFEYVDPSEAAVQPGAAVLSGWPAPDWGQLRAASVCPRWEALGSIVDLRKLEDVADELYHLHQGS